MWRRCAEGAFPVGVRKKMRSARRFTGPVVVVAPSLCSL
jgi:hypothetical protein